MQRREAQEELEMILRAQQGEPGIIEALLTPYYPLLRMLAHRLCCGANCSPEELFQAGYMGMMHAVYRYDPCHQTKLITYAVPWALGEMRRTLCRADDALGSYEKRRKIAKEEERLSQALGRSPRLEELAKACGLSMTQLALAMEAGAPALSMDGENEEHLSLEETICGEAGISVESVDLRLAMEKLGEEERKTICLRFYRDLTQQETARLMNKSQTQISRIERRALDQLYALLR